MKKTMSQVLDEALKEGKTSEVFKRAPTNFTQLSRWRTDNPDIEAHGKVSGKEFLVTFTRKRIEEVRG